MIKFWNKEALLKDYLMYPKAYHFYKMLSGDGQCLKLKPKKLLLDMKENMKTTKEMDTEEV